MTGVNVTSLRSFLQGAASVELERVGLDSITRTLLDLIEEIRGQFHVNVRDGAGIQTGEMTMGITAVAVEATTGPIKALDHASRLQGFEILVNGCVTDAASAGVQPFENVSGTEVASFRPQQVENHAPLATESHPKGPALLEHLLQPRARLRSCDGGVVAP